MGTRGNFDWVRASAAPSHIDFPCLFVFVQATESPSRRPSSVSLPKLPWAIENVEYRGKPDVLLETCALVLYFASAVAETEGTKALMAEIVKDPRD